MNADTAIGVLVSQIEGAVAGLTPIPVVAMGWPTPTQLAQVASNGKRIVSVYDKGIAHNTTRWAADPVLDTPQPTGLTTTVSETLVPVGQQATITLGGTVFTDDAVSFLSALGKTQLGWVQVMSAGDTPSTMASKLAAQINASYLTVSVTGPVITITNNATEAITIGSYTGNLVSRIIDGARIMRFIQVILWCNSPSDRATVANAVVPLLVKLKVNFGAQSSNGEWVRLCYSGDLYSDDDVKSRLYKRSLMVQMEYSETFQDNLYAVLAPILTEQVENNIDSTVITVT